MPQKKEQNKVSVVKYRQKLKEQMGEVAYKAKMAEAKRLQREKAKQKKADEIQNKKLVMSKTQATLKGSNIVADIFTSVLNAIPNDKPKPKRGRKIVYKPTENMSDKDKRFLVYLL
jgi:hypothetical protein